MREKNEYELNKFLGPFKVLIEPGGAFVTAAVCAYIVYSSSGDGGGALLCGTSILCLAWSARIDRKRFNQVAQPPIFFLTLAGFTRWGLGGILLLLGTTKEGDWFHIFRLHAAKSMSLWAAFTLVFLITAQAMTGKAKERSRPACEKELAQGRLASTSIVLGAYVLIYSIFQIKTGLIDRGGAYTDNVGNTSALGMALTALLRLKDFFYVLLPLSIQELWDLKKREGRLKTSLIALALGVTAVTALVVGLISGGRGNVALPISLLFFGTWATRLSKRLLRVILLAIVPSMLLFSVGMNAIRQSAEFQAGTMTNPLKRIETIAKQSVDPNTYRAEGSSVNIGGQLYGASDAYLFSDINPDKDLKAGTRGIGNPLSYVLPKVLYRNKTDPNDGHLIALRMMNKESAGVVDGKYTWFPNISFPGDLYRRWRIAGLLTGSLVFSVFYVGFAKAWDKYAMVSYKSAYSTCIAFIPASFSCSLPLRSLNETLWNWAYDVPKMLVTLAIACLLAKSVAKTLFSGKVTSD